MAKIALAVVQKPLTLDQLIDRMEDIRDAKRPLAAQVEKLEEEYKTVKLQVIALLDASKNLKGGTRRANVSISENTVPVVANIINAAKFVIKGKYGHIFLAQPFSTPSWRELRGIIGKDLPGTSTFTKRDLTHSSIKVV